MVRTYDWRDTYCAPEFGNVRYPSRVKEAYDGWAYYYTQDAAAVADLARYHRAEVLSGGVWVPCTRSEQLLELYVIEQGEPQDPYDPLDPNGTHDHDD